MTTYNTGNPIGSKDPRDLYDNAENLDEAVNTRQAESWDDRFGVARKTWWGMEQDFQQFLIDSGYVNIGDYGPGLEITERNQIFWRDGELYRAGASLELPYTTTGDWGAEEGLFVAVGDASLRQDLAAPSGSDLIGFGDGTLTDEINSIKNRFILVTPDLFDIEDNSLADQTEKIRAMHSFANLNSFPVKYVGLSSVYVQADAQIDISTDVDFYGCVFKLLNGMNPDPTHSYNRLFFVVGEEIQTDISIDPLTLTRNSRRPTDLLGNDLPDGFYNINSDRPVGNRSTSPEIMLYYQQSFQVIKGEFTYPCCENLSNSTIEVSYRKNDTPITIDRFCADASTYNNQNLIRVERNGVTIKRPTIIISDEDPSGVCSEFSALMCCGFLLEDARAGTKVTDGSSYVLNLNRVSDVTFNRVKASGKGSWGVTGTNWVTNWKILDCDLNRVDTHQGLFGLTFKGGSLTKGSVQYGYGGGHIDISDIVCFSGEYVLRPRTDYSGNFQGSLSVRDIKIILNRSELASGDVIGIMDFRGISPNPEVSQRWATEIFISNISIDYTGDTTGVSVVPVNAARTGATLSGINIPNKIRISDVRCTRGLLPITIILSLSRYGDPLQGRLDLDIENIVSLPSETFPLIDGFANIGPSGIQEYETIVTVRNCKGVMSKTGWKNTRFVYENCDLSSVWSDWGGVPENTELFTYNCRMVDTSQFAGQQVGRAGRASLTSHSNLSILDTSYLVFAQSLSGITIKSGVTCDLPSTVTPQQALQGWVSGSVFET